MQLHSSRYRREIEHNRKILPHADKIWGRESFAGKLRIQRRVGMIMKEGNISKGKLALEIGCGTGVISKLLACSQATIIATDIFDEFLTIAKKNNSHAHLMFQKSDAHTLISFKDSTFDVIYGVSILHHLEAQKALKSMHRVLKPGGFILFSEPNMLNPQIAIQKNIPFIKSWLGDSPDETAFFRWQAHSLLKAQGFRAIRITPFDFLHPAIPDIFAKPLLRLGNMLEKIPLLKEIAGSLFIKAQK